MICVSTKPVIAYIDTNYGSYSNRAQEAADKGFLFYVKNDCRVNVLGYNWHQHFIDDANNIKQLISNQRLLLIIVQQDEYYDEQTESVEYIRQNYGYDIPIIVFHAGYSENWYVAKPDDKNTHVLSKTNPEVGKMIIYLANQYYSKNSWFGAVSTNEKAKVIQQLVNSYQKNDDGCCTYESDENHKIVAEACRLITMCSPELISDEFDDSLKDDNEKVFKSFSKSVYEKDLKKVKSFIKKGFKKFKDDMSIATGNRPLEGGGYMRFSTCDDSVYGFAIDPVTLEIFMSNRFSEHSMCQDILAYRINTIEALRKKTYWLETEEERSINHRIMPGLVFTKLPGLTVPILKFTDYGVSDEGIEKVLKHIISDRKFIAIWENGQIAEPFLG